MSKISCFFSFKGHFKRIHPSWSTILQGEVDPVSQGTIALSKSCETLPWTREKLFLICLSERSAPMLAWDTPQQQSVLGNLTKNMPIMWSNKTVSITHNITVISYKLYKVCSVIYTVSTVLRLQINTLLGPMMLSFAQVLPTWGSLHDKVRLCVAANASRIQRVYIYILISVLQPCSTCPNIILPPTNSKHQSRMNQVLCFPSNKNTHWRREKASQELQGFNLSRS